MNDLTRTQFTMSRANEFFTTKELQVMTGVAQKDFATSILKELADNALDAAESCKIDPELCIEVVERDRQITISISDNGPGLSAETLAKILDFQTRTTDKAHYRSPTRGTQGNALKTVFGMAHAMGGKPVVVEALGVKHTVAAKITPANELVIDHDQDSIALGVGTKLTVEVPGADWSNGRPTFQNFAPSHWARAFALFNPHISVKFTLKTKNEEEIKHAEFDLDENTISYHRTESITNGWRKLIPTDPTSAHWYLGKELEALAFAHIAHARQGGRDINLRDFVRQFRGLSSTSKAKDICTALPGIARLSDFEADTSKVRDLHELMKAAATAPKPEVLGCIGKLHMESRLREFHASGRRFWYKSANGATSQGIPFGLEVGLLELKDEEPALYSGINYSPTFRDPFGSTWLRTGKAGGNGVTGYLFDCKTRVNPQAPYGYIPVAVVVHLVCPRIDFMDKGKTSMTVHDEIRAPLADSLWSVAKTIYAEQKLADKDAAKAEKQAAERERKESTPRLTMRDAVFTVMEAAYDSCSDHGKYAVYARDLFYEVRPRLSPLTDKELDYTYFSQTLLVQFRREVKDLPNVCYKPRGVLNEPHTKRQVPLGTREVDGYEFPKYLYNKILYIEKSGVFESFNATKIAERYDMAIISAEGYACEAARTLLMSADKEQAYKIFVLHDADIDGYNIARTLAEETARMPGYKVEVIDLGLHVEESLALGLQSETYSTNKKIPAKLELREGEHEFFTVKKSGDQWIRRRVELNALPVPRRADFLEEKLKAHGATEKVIPPSDKLPALAEGILEDQLAFFVVGRIEALLDLAAISDTVVKAIHPAFNSTQAESMIRAEFEKDRSRPWDRALQDALHGQIRKTAPEIDARIQMELKQALSSRFAR